MSKHNEHSSYREKLIEHLFIGELLKLSWLKHDCGLEVAKPEVDNSGYDVLVECYGIVRHIQLKTSHLGSSTSQQKIHIKLADKPSGCMVWIIFNEDTLKFDHFLFYGDKAGEPLPCLDDLKVAKHTKGNSDGIKAERPNIRVINKGQFLTVRTVEELFNLLFINEFTGLVVPAEMNQSIKSAINASDFKKLHRIEKWSKNRWQKNSQLITTFLELELLNTNVSLDLLIEQCSKRFGGSASEWKNNFNSMKTDHGHSHGKVFLVSDTNVNLYAEARQEVSKYF